MSSTSTTRLFFSVGLLISVASTQAMWHKFPKILPKKRYTLPIVLAGAAAAGHSISTKKATTADKLIDCFADFSEKDYSTLKSLIKSPSTPSSQSSIQSIIPKFNPEIFLQEPKKQTPEQLLEKDIFKKFRLTYTGNVPIKVDMLLNKLGNLTQDQEILEGEAPFDIANLQNANSMNTLLLYGNPGNGKSYMIGELSRATGIRVLSCTASLLQSSWKHQTAENVKTLFEYIKKEKDPIILFIDEVDPIAGKQTGHASSISESVDTLKMLLDKIDEVKYKKNVFIVAGTNHIYFLEKAFLSRFTSKIEIAEPKELVDYESFFAYNYKQHGLHDRIAESKKLAQAVFKSSTRGSWAGKVTHPYSRRNLTNIIPFVLAAKQTDFAKQGKETPDQEKFLKTIDIKADAVFIKAAISNLEEEYQAEHTVPELSAEMKILKNATNS